MLSLSIFEELHVFNNAAFAVIIKLMLNSLLFDKALPVQLGLAHSIYFSGPVINRPHDVVQVVIRDFLLFMLDNFLILFVIFVL